MSRGTKLLTLIIGILISVIAIAGTNTIPTRSTGQTILPDFFNTIKTALTGELVPRNVSGVATDEAGDLGTNSLRWRDGFFSRYLYVGTAAELNRLSPGSNQLNFQIGGVTKVTIGANGLAGGGLEDGTVTFAKLSTDARIKSQDFTSNATWVVPTGVTRIFALVVGGGGGGGGGAGFNGSSGISGGAGGGGGVLPVFSSIAVTPGETLTMNVGSGGAGGPGAGLNTAGSGGSNGVESSIYRSGTLLLQCAGGIGGAGSPSGGGAGGGGDGSYFPSGMRVGGGSGGSPQVSGAVGTASFYGSGGGAGWGGASAGGGGGGGGAGFGNGGAGGSGQVGTSGLPGSAGGTGAGGGGGSGGSSVGAVGGTGGAGGGGLVRIIWIGPN